MRPAHPPSVTHAPDGAADPRPRHALLAALVLAQVAFWYLATPGPALLGGEERGLPLALRSIAWSLLLLGVLPLAFARAGGIRPSDVGWRPPRWRPALGLAGGLLLLALPLLWVAAGDPAMRASYPWPGPWLAEAPWRIVMWAPLYGLYYLAFETFYRGVLLRTLAPWWGTGAANWTQATCACLVHVGKPLAETVVALPASLLFGLLALRTRSLVVPWLLHLGVGVALDAFVLLRTAPG